MSSPPEYSSLNLAESKIATNPLLTVEQKYKSIIQKYEINTYFSQKLQILNSYKIVFVFDDSGSMNTILQDSPLNNKSASLANATRWDELKYFANISIEIASLFNRNGCDIYFLNRFNLSPIKNIKDPIQLEQYFQDKPKGFTPLAQVFRSVLKDNSMNVLGEKKLLIIIATDGEPTDMNGQVNISEFKRCLKEKPKHCHTTIVACTDDDASVSYLNKWDRKISNLDVVDDYRSERNEVLKVRGKNYSFSFGDYVVKSLIGSIDPELDALDEKKNPCLIL